MAPAMGDNGQTICKSGRLDDSTLRLVRLGPVWCNWDR